IHVAMVPVHADDRMLAVAFVLTGAVQAALALAVSGRPTRQALLATMGISAVAIVAWGVSRTVGLPVGDHAGEPEAIGAIDLVCVGLQLVSLVLATRALVLPSLPFAPRFGSLV